jgi:lipopolysaccharide export system protein LptA
MPMPKTADNRPVYVKCDEFVITQGNVATNPTTTICRGNVSVDDARGTLRCSTLTIESQANSRRPERVIAEGDVVVEQSDKRLACTRAVYLAADERIDVTGPTNWRMGDREGSSDRLSMDLTNKTYRAIGAVRMRLPSGSGGNFLWLTPTESLSAESESAAGKPKITGSPEPVDISSDDFEFRSARPPSDLDEVVYRGNVRVRGPQDMTLDCRTLTGKIPPGTNQMQTLIAEQNVIVRVKSPAGDRIGRGDIATYDGASEELEFTGTNQVEIVFYDKSGETLARGKRIVYSRKSDVAVMTGNPVVTSEKGVITGETLVMDRSKGVLKATGGWRLRIPTNSVAQVSLPAPPKKTKR